MILCLLLSVSKTIHSRARHTNTDKRATCCAPILKKHNPSLSDENTKSFSSVFSMQHLKKWSFRYIKPEKESSEFLKFHNKISCSFLKIFWNKQTERKVINEIFQKFRSFNCRIKFKKKDFWKIWKTFVFLCHIQFNILFPSLHRRAPQSPKNIHSNNF